MSGLGTVMQFSTRGFKTAKGSLYAMEDKSNISTRYKADFSKGDGGLQQPMLVGFISPQQIDIARDFYRGARSGFGHPVFGIVSPKLPRFVQDHVFDGNPVFVGMARDFKVFDNFSASGSGTVHLLARRRNEQGVLTREWFSLGQVAKNPAVGLAPLELNPFKGGLFHLGHKITEVYDNAARLTASIRSLRYPVRVGSGGHLELTQGP